MKTILMAILVICSVALINQTAAAQLMGHDALEFSSESMNGSDYYKWTMNKSATHERVDVCYSNPGGILNGDKNFDSKYKIYETQKTGSSIFSSTDLPSVGFGGSGSNYCVKAGMGKATSGKMNLTFKRFTRYAGFKNIRNSNESVRISIESGEVDITWKQGWNMPVVEFDNLASGEINSGNVHIVIDKNHNMKLSTRSMPGYRGAKSMCVRASNNPYEYQIYGNGSAKKVRNPDFKAR